MKCWLYGVLMILFSLLIQRMMVDHPQPLLLRPDLNGGGGRWGWTSLLWGGSQSSAGPHIFHFFTFFAQLIFSIFTQSNFYTFFTRPTLRRLSIINKFCPHTFHSDHSIQGVEEEDKFTKSSFSLFLISSQIKNQASSLFDIFSLIISGGWTWRQSWF